jgi:hypothetical protein
MGKRGRKTQFIKCSTCLLIDKSRIGHFGKKYVGTHSDMECMNCCQEQDGSIKNKLAKKCRACCSNGHFSREEGTRPSIRTPAKLPCDHITGGIMVPCTRCGGCNVCHKCDSDTPEPPHQGIGSAYLAENQE